MSWGQQKETLRDRDRPISSYPQPATSKLQLWGQRQIAGGALGVRPGSSRLSHELVGEGQLKPRDRDAVRGRDTPWERKRERDRHQERQWEISRPETWSPISLRTPGGGATQTERQKRREGRPPVQGPTGLACSHWLGLTAIKAHN